MQDLIVITHYLYDKLLTNFQKERYLNLLNFITDIQIIHMTKPVDTNILLNKEC